jgi:hypothetical protein
MIVVCKHKKTPGRLEEYRDLIIGEKYISLTDFYDKDIMIELVDDSGLRCWYPKENFTPLDVERELRLNQLGIK